MKEFLSFRLDAADQSLWRDGQRVPLTPKAFSVLHYLVDRAGRLVTQSELLDALWPNTFVQPEVLKSQILDVRTALGDRPKDPLYIETVPRRGYRFIARVSDVEGTALPDPSAGTPAQRPDAARIAVLPFVNMSADAENEYFSDGLTEELINCLAGVSSLQVVARTSVFQFKGVNRDIRTIGLQLNVGTILEGSVRRAADQLRVTAQLIDVKSGIHLFSKTYQREFKDVFQLQDDIARAVTAEIVPAGAAPPAVRLESRTDNLDAYNAYLRGVYAMSNRFGDLAKSVDHFREALAFDPRYAPAWAGMAHTYFILAWFYLASPDTVMPLSRAAALKAQELDPDSSHGLVPLGVSEGGMDWQWHSAESRFRRALDLQPADAQGHVWFTFFCLLPQRRNEDAIELMERAVNLDPLNPMFRAGLIYVYGVSGRYEHVVREYSIARNLAPQYGPTHVAAGFAFECTGHVEEAIPIYRLGCELAANGPYAMSSLGHALASTGHQEEALRIIDALQAAPIRTEPEIARVFYGLGREDLALDWLERGLERRSLYLLRTVDDPRLDRLRPHPRFQAILGRMGLR
jgi:TolB-like protein/TPR repeat protein